MNKPHTSMFSDREYAQRLKKAQHLMDERGLDMLLLTTPPEFYYFTGFLTRFWESPTRPWYLLVPRSGKPIAVIPSIGEALMRQCAVGEILTWSSPDLCDDGISLLTDTIRQIVGNGTLAIPDGHETHVRMPLSSLQLLEANISPATLVSDQNIIRRLRMIKSPAEIEKIRTSCEIAGRAFSRIGEIAHAGTPLDEIFRNFQRLCLEEGADWVNYLAGAAGPNGYVDVISPATPTPIETGDILMLDTGLVRDGYFCDFNRNYAIGRADDTIKECHKRLMEATEAGFEAARPGRTAKDLFHAMNAICSNGAQNGQGETGAGRLGHGLGLSLTEWPSLIAEDKTELEAGMVLTMEPGIVTAGGNMLVHEENIVITRDGAEYLTRPSSPELPILEG